MLAAAPRRRFSTPARDRKRKYQDRLESFGFVHGFRRHRGFNGTREGSLGRTLQDLGPVFAAFGIYLSSRVDLFSPEECIDLARIPDCAAPLPFEQVSAVVGGECGQPIERMFPWFEKTPVESRLAWQAHRARWRDCSSVIVRVLRPDFAAQARCDADWFVSCDPSCPLGAAAHDFHAALLASLDLRVTAEALLDQARHALRMEGLASPQIVRECTSRNMLVLQAIPGGGAGHGDRNVPDLARQLCLRWLAEALEGRVFPVEPRPENIMLTAGRISFVAGEFSSLPAATQQTLWEYLDAASQDDPDAAADRLLREMDLMTGCLGEKAFVQQIRQIVPFRDGAWADSSGQSLPERLFLQWQIAVRCGYRPQPHLVAFWRGLFTVTAAARRFSGQHQPLSGDIFASALFDYRTMRLVRQIQTLMDLQQMPDRLESYSMAAVEFPRRMNQLLEAAESGRTRLQLRTGNSPATHSQSTRLVVLLSLVSATILWTVWFSVHSSHRIVAERVGSIILFLLGILLIRGIAKVR